MAVRSVDYYNLEALFTDGEILTRDNLRGFLEKAIAPLVREAFHAEEPLDIRDIALKLGDLGVIGPFIPPEYGGQGSNYITFGLICQEMERVDSALHKIGRAHV